MDWLLRVDPDLVGRTWLTLAYTKNVLTLTWPMTKQNEGRQFDQPTMSRTRRGNDQQVNKYQMLKYFW